MQTNSRTKIKKYTEAISLRFLFVFFLAVAFFYALGEEIFDLTVEGAEFILCPCG